MCWRSWADLPRRARRDALPRLNKGQMSAPVHSSFGWHLIELLDTRNVDKTDAAQPSCQERYNFGRDQQFIGSSGQEFTYGKYLYADTGDGLPALAIQTQYDNNATDCSGNRVDQTGDILVAYVKQQGEQMQWCKDSKGTRCDMTLQRVLP